MYDVIVVGARCAGAPTAMLLARRGYRVLLVDRATFPSDTMSTHIIHQPGVAALKRWGLLEAVLATGCPPTIHGMTDAYGFVLWGTPPPADGVTIKIAPRRTVLDKLLVEAAVAAGAELREGFTVESLRWDGDRVTGIRGHARAGATLEEHARLVIGADGLHSLVARAVQAPTYHERPSLSCGYYAYWSGVPMEGGELYLRAGRAIIGFPTNNGLSLFIAAWPVAEFHTYRADIEGNYLRTLEQVPELAERVNAGRREERFIGSADFPNFFRTPYGPGWALVGDAGYHKDPATAQGITDAFRDAEQLTEAVDAGFSGRQDLMAALADYERCRDETVTPMYDFTCRLATLEPPAPEQLRLFAALQGNQEEINRFLGTTAGTVPIPEFYAPDNIRRIIAASAATAALVPPHAGSA